MALIKCPECGSQISDTATKCPHCGYALKADQITTHSKSVIGGILLTVSLVLLVLGYWWTMRMSFDYSAESRHLDLQSGFLWGGIGVWSISFVSFYFGWKFLNQGIFKSKTAIITSCIFGAVIVYAFGLASFNTINRDKQMAEEAEFESYKEQLREDRFQKEQEEAERKRQEEQKWLGTYEYNHAKNGGDNKTLVITINDDETATAVMKGRTEKTFYGHWNKLGGYNNKPISIQLHFDDTQSYVPRYGNHGGGYVNELVAWTGWGEYLDMSNAVLYDGYLYENSSYAESKNPNRRVQVTKVK